MDSHLKGAGQLLPVSAPVPGQHVFHITTILENDLDPGVSIPHHRAIHF